GADAVLSRAKERGVAMDHRQALSLTSAYLDGELAADSRAALEGHLAGCADCRAAFGAERAFVARIRSTASYHEAPQGLAASLTERLRAQVSDGVQLPQNVVPLKPGAAPSRRDTPWRPLALAASFVLAVLLSGGVGYMSSLPASGDLIVQEVV